MSSKIQKQIEQVAQAARKAAGPMALATRRQKDQALFAIARALRKSQSAILKANALDMAAAEKARLAPALLDRLRLDPERLNILALAVESIAKLPDPVGRLLEKRKLYNGVQLSKVRVPLGVIGIVYESRPNVTVDAAVLCLKAGNATVLRGGSEAIHSNIALGQAVRQGLKAAGLPAAAVSVIPVADRAAVRAMLKLDKLIDVIIPRGGHGLIRAVIKHSSIPVIRHDIGNCHVYIDKAADLKMAQAIAYNAKVQRPGVCNAMEHLLVHRDVAKRVLPPLFARFRQAGVELRGDAAVRAIDRGVKPASEADWATEYLDLICGVKVVKDLNQAIAHINHYGSSHSDAIVTGNKKAAERFLREVDSAAVYHNASTRFTDGGEFGLGAEIGISTQKLHARGPMALDELTSIKWVARGKGQVRA